MVVFSCYGHKNLFSDLFSLSYFNGSSNSCFKMVFFDYVGGCGCWHPTCIHNPCNENGTDFNLKSSRKNFEKDLEQTSYKNKLSLLIYHLQEIQIMPN